MSSLMIPRYLTLIKRLHIIVFLNKCDLLDKKLKSGVAVNKYIPRYGDRENSMPVFGRCTSCLVVYLLPLPSDMEFSIPADLRDKFKDYMNEYSPERRPFYGYLTSVVVCYSVYLLSRQSGC
jgi:guanine nucleotide-binding protein alpha-1 subunit